MVTRVESLYTWLSLPIYIWQGLAVRKKTERMEPPTYAKVPPIKGKGVPIRILIIGDSSAAGVGVDDINHSLGGHLSRILNEKSGRPTSVHISGNNSATAGALRDHVVPNLAREEYDYISLNIGVNDAKNFHTGKRFCKEFGTLLYALQARFPHAQLIWGGVIDMENVPALTAPLNKILSIRSRILDRNGKILCEERGALAPKSNWKVIPENFARDGFHASSLGYQRWADELSDYILSIEKTRAEESPT